MNKSNHGRNWVLLPRELAIPDIAGGDANGVEQAGTSDTPIHGLELYLASGHVFKRPEGEEIVEVVKVLLSMEASIADADEGGDALRGKGAA